LRDGYELLGNSLNGRVERSIVDGRRAGREGSGWGWERRGDGCGRDGEGNRELAGGEGGMDGGIRRGDFETEAVESADDAGFPFDIRAGSDFDFIAAGASAGFVRTGFRGGFSGRFGGSDGHGFVSAGLVIELDFFIDGAGAAGDFEGAIPIRIELAAGLFNEVVEVAPYKFDVGDVVVAVFGGVCDFDDEAVGGFIFAGEALVNGKGHGAAEFPRFIGGFGCGGFWGGFGSGGRGGEGDAGEGEGGSEDEDGGFGHCRTPATEE
jgi:hypothetical protein